MTNDLEKLIEQVEQYRPVAADAESPDKMALYLVDEILAALRQAKRDSEAVKAVEKLIDESDGVVGLHRNGDISEWDDLLRGGQFEEWLIAFSEAINATTRGTP